MFTNVTGETGCTGEPGRVRNSRRPARGRAYCFTQRCADTCALATALSGEQRELDAFLESAQLRYICAQRETGSGGFDHYQGYCEFISDVTLSAAKTRLCSPNVHLERRRGSAEQAIAYCRKPESAVSGSFVESGTPLRQGQRTDLESIRERLDAGASVFDISREYFGQWCRYRNSFSVYALSIAPPRTWKTHVSFIRGPPGCGKTSSVHAAVGTGSSGGGGSLYTLPVSGGTTWFDGYDPLIHTGVLIDDFTPSVMPWKLLMNLCDRYPMSVQVKGGTVAFLAKRIFITSNYQPEELYEKVPGDVKLAFYRRIDSYWEFQRPGKWNRSTWGAGWELKEKDVEIHHNVV